MIRVCFFVLIYNARVFVFVFSFWFAAQDHEEVEQAVRFSLRQFSIPAI